MTHPEPPAPGDLPAPDPAEVHDRSVAIVRSMDSGDLDRLGRLLGELAGPEEFAAQVVSLASLARLLLDQLPDVGEDQDAAREAVLLELSRALIAAEGSSGDAAAEGSSGDAAAEGSSGDAAAERADGRPGGRPGDGNGPPAPGA